MKQENPTRRRFAAAVAGLAVAPLALADDPPKPPANPSDGLFESLKARYGKDLSEDELKQLQKSVSGQAARSRAIAAVKLTNADDPAVAFRADLP